MKFAFLALTAILVSAHVEAADFVVKVRGIEQATGVLMVGVFDSAATFRKTPLAQSPSVPVGSTGEITVSIRALPPGQYAVIAFQDLNGNETLDLGPLGIPVEPYAISGQPKLRIGPPEFVDAAFLLGSDGLTLELRLD